MRSRNYPLIGVALLTLFFASEAKAQFSVGAHFGYAGSVDGGDAYGLNTPWPSALSGGGGSMVFTQGGTGTSALLNLTWEATSILGISLVYHTSSQTMAESKRRMTSNSIGIQVKVNFVRNIQKVVPFFQAGYFFSNSNTVKQEAAVSSKYPSQVMPAFEFKYSTTLGVSGDLGVEFKLSQPVSFVIQAGLHGVQLASEPDVNASSLDLGPSYRSPSNFDGAFWFQATGGVKYYFGKGKKKRDF